MDRRVVVGLAGIALAVASRSSPAQTAPARDPSAQPSVALEPIPSIGDSINNTTTIPAAVPLAPSAAPTSPVGQGRARDATAPKSPISPSPVSMSPIEPIDRSINRGFGTGFFGSMFRRQSGPPAPTLRATPRTEPASRLGGPASPSTWPAPPADGPNAPPTAAGRPAPFAGRSPAVPRAQADPVNGPASAPSSGRPAPYAQDRPRSARPKAQPANPPAYRPAEVPAAPPATTDPAPASPEPSPASNPSPGPSPEDRAPPPGLDSAATPPPLGLDPLAGLDPVPPQVPPVVPTPAPVEPLAAPEPSPSPSPGPVDAEVGRTSYQADLAIRTGIDKPKKLSYATRTAAAVGDEIITINELSTAVNNQMKELLGDQQSPMSQGELHQVTNQVAASVLNRMIDQALILQEANKIMQKNTKAKQAFDEFIDKQWKTEEVPPLLRKTASANVHELKIKLAAEGKSYEAMKEAFRKKLLSNDFLRSQIHNKVTSDMIELRLYYGKHLDQFDMPARVTWREIEVNVARYPGRPAARQKAEEVLARLLRDEDFAAVARSTSNGPTASKGGVYVDMQPGSYGIPVVNDELNRIPVGQVSQVLEAPGSFYIVRVDSRREKGPLRFEEVQDKIRDQVLKQNFDKAVEDYLVKLRAKTLIRTMFDNTASDPELARRNDPAVRPASR